MAVKTGTPVWRASDGKPGRVIRAHKNGEFGTVYRVRWWTRDEDGTMQQHSCGKTFGDLVDPRGSWRLKRPDAKGE